MYKSHPQVRRSAQQAEDICESTGENIGSENMETLCMSLLFGGMAAFLLYKYLTSRGQKLPPGPRGLSALLSVLKAFRDGSLHKQARVWYDQYGDLVLCRTVIGEICFLNSARLVKEMYASKERELVTNDRPPSFFGWFTFGYNDITTSDSSRSVDWVKRRKVFHYAIKFYGDGVERFESTVQTELQRLTSRIETRAGEEVDFDNLLSYSLLCVLTVLMAGECPEPGAANTRAIKDFDTALNDLFDPTVDGILTAFPFLRFVPGTFYRDVCGRMSAAKDRLNAEFFATAKETHTPGCQRGIVDVLLDEQLKGDNQWLTDDIIKAIIQDIVAGGFVTSFSTLKGLFLYLAHNPEVTRRLQKEINDVLGDRIPCVSDRSALPYCEAVVLETIRCNCMLPLSVPHLTRDDVKFEDYTVPKGCQLFANIWVIQRDPEVYTDPDLFRPERFLDDVTGQLLPPSHPVRQSLLQFGIGKRSCPGESFARTRIFLYVTTLLQKFDILPPVKHQLPPPDPSAFKSALVLEPKPYHLIFRRRSMT